MEIISFTPESIENAMAKMKDSDIDDLAFGAVKLDKTGKILAYNAAEGDITGRDPKEVIGKNFFEEVAPCTKSPEFFGKFEEGVNAGEMSTVFNYTFDYQMNPTQVTVHMKNDIIDDDAYWIFVKRL